MRIVYMLTSLGMGGAEKQVVALAARMAGRGHTVRIVSLMPPKAEQWPTALDVFYLDIRKTPRSALGGLMRAQSFLRAFRPDIVHSHSFHANMLGRLLTVLLPELAVVSTVHNVYEGGRLRMLAYRLTGRLCRRTVAVSHAALDRFTRMRAVAAARCCVIANGIDLAEFAPDSERRRQMRRQMKVDAEFVWLASGRVVPAKDYPNLLRAAAIVRLTHPWARVWIAGGWSDREMDRLRSMPEFRQLEDMVLWLGLRRDLPSLLDAADGFVSSSAWEGMPLAVGEAMAMGKQLVATDVGGVRELVGLAGALVRSRDPAALAAAMREAMDKSGTMLAADGTEARLRIEKHFNMDRKPEEWEKLYGEAIAGQSTHAAARDAAGI